MTQATAARPQVGQPVRSTADVLAGRIRIRLAGREFVLPILTIRENDEWQATLETELQPILAEYDDLDQTIAALQGFGDRLMPLLRSYDRGNVLPPPGEWERDIYPNELLMAVMEVRLAADPTLAFAIADYSERRAREREAAELRTTSATQRLSSWLRRMGGPLGRSGKI